MTCEIYPFLFGDCGVRFSSACSGFLTVRSFNQKYDDEDLTIKFFGIQDARKHGRILDLFSASFLSIFYCFMTNLF